MFQVKVCCTLPVFGSQKRTFLSPQTVARPTDAQRQAGATLASQGGGGAVAACSSCHGTNGEGNAQMVAPRLAGQAYAYLLHELDSYAGDTRAHPVMAPIAKAMTPEQRAAAAAHYASLGGASWTAAAATDGCSELRMVKWLAWKESRCPCSRTHRPISRKQ